MAAKINNVTEYTIAADYAKVVEMVNIGLDEFNSLTLNNMTGFSRRLWTILEEKYADYRGKEYPLMDSPMPTFFMVFTFLSFVLYFGPLCMRNRKPFELRKVLIYYNVFQVILSAYMFYEHLMAGWLYDYNLLCQPVDYSDSPKAMRMLNLYYIYYLSKLTEFSDTIFFVLRKKQSQMTGLHLYHHSLTPIESYFLFRFLAGGNATLPNILNNFAHVFMYLYYMVAAMGPEYEKHLWWKKHITIIQIFQFIIGISHAVYGLLSDCQYSAFVQILLIVHGSIFMVLFTNFYIDAYKKESRLVKKAKKTE